MPKKNFPPKVGDGRFEVQDKLGEGCFGAVFLGKDKKSDSPVAVKFEDSQCGAPGSLAMENSLLKQLGEPQRPQGFAEVFFFGKVGSFTCMVMDLLGKSLEECMEVCQGKMEPSSVVLIAEQALRRIEYLHSKGVVHRDIKPENFMYGRGGKIHHLHLIDFGLSDTYWGRRHVSQSNGNSMVGTARYCSVNTHKGINQTRRDDLEAIGHMLMYFLRGSLPWSGLDAKTQEEKYRKIREKKESTPLDELCAGHPPAFKDYLLRARSLEFKERPDYIALRKLFADVRAEIGPQQDHGFQFLEGRDLGTLEPLEFIDVRQPDDQAPTGGFSFCFCGSKSAVRD
mmetsp:Transcript_11423/g.23759  ORF Transcript_11423/g.23759 Transcript_11423/m.23759 type:complete len:340 (+) Transcript_11423:78-1097(+)